MSISIFSASVAFLTGFLTGAVEAFARYRDEPFKVFSSPFGCFYLLLNGLLGLAAYAILIETIADDATLDSMTHLRYALMGGLGAAVVIRARIFSARVGEEEVAIGPGYVVDQLLATLDQQIDRARARQRMQIVTETMIGLDFDRTSEYAITMILGSTQNLSLQGQKDLASRIREIRSQRTRDSQKTMALGFTILDFMGEQFLRDLVAEPQREKLSAAAELDSLPEASTVLDNASLVRAGLSGVHFDEARKRFDEVMAEIKPPVSQVEQQELLAEISQIEAREIPDQNKSHAIGFLVLDVFGRETFERHFPPPGAKD